jgi:hypothetical protein
MPPRRLGAGPAAYYGPGWQAHVVSVRVPSDLDGELRGWLQESHDTVGLQRGGDDPEPTPRHTRP